MDLADEQSEESALRTAIAAYFLQTPPPDLETAETTHRLGQWLAMEWQCLLGFAGRHRPLFSGDLSALVGAIAGAASPLLSRHGRVLQITMPPGPLPLSYEPRLLPLALTLLLRSAAVGHAVRLTVQPHRSAFVLSFKADRPFPLWPWECGLREIAWLHGGRLLLSHRLAVLSLSRTEKAVGEAPSPTAFSFSQNPLSPFVLGWYASPPEEEAPGSVVGESAILPPEAGT